MIYNLGADEVEIPAGPFVIYQGSHGDRGAHRADVILPGAAWTEEPGHLRQHRGAAADGEPRRLPAGRGAGELGDPAGAVGGAGQDAAVRLAGGAARGGWWRRRRISARIDVVPENAWTPLEAAGDVRGGDFAVGRWRSTILANPIMRASEVMAELARLARRPGRPGRWRRSRRHGVLHTRLRALRPDPGAVPGGDAGGAREPRVPDVRRPQDLGGGADAPRAERGRARGGCCRASPTS